jgi:hypothetical protein
MHLRLSSHRALSPVLAIVASACFSAPASAHVKWFCPYQITGSPSGLENVLCQDFEQLVGLAIAVLLAGCLVDRCFIGSALTRALDRVTAPLRSSEDVIMRAACGFFLVSLWVLGGILLTPELTTTSPVVPWLQLFCAACLVTRKTTVIAAIGIVGLFVAAVWNYGIFHLADYPIFLGIAAYLAAISLNRTIFGARPIDVMRWSAAVTLMWASIEKWAYPEWSYPLFVSHPGMSMGFDPAFYMRAAGVVEFSLSFALIWTPLVRRCGAIMLASIFISAVAGFGKVDAIGHAPMIAVLLAIAVDDAKQQVETRLRRVELVPVAYAVSLIVFLGAYYGLHAASFGSHSV